jgi:hypothetical protein
VFDLRGFNLNAKLDIDPDFLTEDDHAHHDHEHGENIATTLRMGTTPGVGITTIMTTM